jgi:hypothetical protein
VTYLNAIILCLGAKHKDTNNPEKCQSPPNRLRSAQQTAINATLERLVNSLKTDFGALGDRL